MISITIDEIQNDFMNYFHRVRYGESFIVTQAGRPMAEIKPTPARSSQKRPFGLCAGEFVVPDDFDEPLPGEILNLFEGKMKLLFISFNFRKLSFAPALFRIAHDFSTKL